MSRAMLSPLIQTLSRFLSSPRKTDDDEAILLGSRESALTSAVRATASTSVLTAAAIAIGGSQATIGFIGSATYLTKTAQGLAEPLVRRFGLVKVLVASATVERLGLLAVALVLFMHPGHSARVALVASATVMLLGLAVYDMTLTVGYLSADSLSSLGRLFGHRQRWYSILGLIAGLLGAWGLHVAQTQYHLHTQIASSLLILSGAVLSILSAKWTLALIKSFKGIALPPLPNTDTPLWKFRLYSPVQRRTLYFFLVWSFGYGTTISHADASLLTVLHWTLANLLILAAIMTGAGAVGAVGWGKFIDKMGPYPTSLVCVSLMAICHLGYILALWIDSFVVIVAVQIVWGLAYAGWTVVRPILLTDGFQEDTPSQISPIAFYGHVTMLGYAASGLSPIIMSGFLSTLAYYGLSGQVSYTVLFALTTVIRLIALLMLVQIPFKSRVQADAIALTLYGALAERYGPFLSRISVRHIHRD